MRITTTAEQCSQCGKKHPSAAVTPNDSVYIHFCAKCWNREGKDLRLHAEENDCICAFCRGVIPGYGWQVSTGWKSAKELPICRHHVACWNRLHKDHGLPAEADWLDEIIGAPTVSEPLPAMKNPIAELVCSGAVDDGCFGKKAAPNPDDPWPLGEKPRGRPGSLSISAADLELEVWEIFHKEGY